MNEIYLELWITGASSLENISYRIKHRTFLLENNACILSLASEFLGEYLLEQVNKESTNKHNINEKINQLQAIEEVFREKSTLKALNENIYFVKFSNFINSN
jgi:lipopolysaccharide export system protein LptA